MAEFKLGRIRFIWKGTWTTATTYYKDDIVKNGGKTYVCVVGHTASSDFYTDFEHTTPKWEQMGDGQDWKSDWETSTFYKLNDIVKYGGYLYICNNSHTSAATATLGLEDNQSDWDIFSESFDWKGDWDVDTRYKVNDLVKYNGIIYLCNADHTSASSTALGLEDDQSSWDIFSEGFYWRSDWSNGVRYRVNDVVKYGGTVYRCNQGHTSASLLQELSITGGSGTGSVATLNFASQVSQPYAIGSSITVAGVTPSGYDGTYTVTASTTTSVSYSNATTAAASGGTVTGTSSLGLEKDQAKWDYVNKGIEYRSTWSGAGVRYRINDIVLYGPDLWICTTYHSSTTSFDETKWQIFVPGLEFEDSWNDSALYQPGDVVTYGGYSYISKTNNTNATPTASTSDWAVYTTGFKYQGEWGSANSYEVGDVVVVGGYTYLCNTDNTNQIPPNLDYWDKLNSGIRWRRDWTSSTAYKLGDSVKYLENSYICVVEHTSATGNRPDNDINGDYWNQLAGGAEESVLTTQGDIVYYGGAGPTRLPIGDDGQVLKINSGVPVWEYFGLINQVFYVAPSGTDSPAPGYGTTLDKPWKTVRYACEQVEKGVNNPQASYLLEINRQYIQKEVIAWINAQIAGNIAPFTTGFTYDATKCERDTGLVIDAILWDLRHGGNSRAREAALSYVNDAPAFYLAGQAEETVAALNRALSIADAVLSNSAFSSLQGTVSQIIDSDYTEESDAQATVNSLMTIITDALTAGVDDDIPAQTKLNTTIFVKTGTYYEVLPIIVPADVAIVGDELRSTNIRPAGSLVDAGDVAKSLAGLTRLKAVIGDVVQGTSVTKTPSNTQTQTIVTPYGSLATGTAVQDLVQDAYDHIDKAINNVGSYPTLTGSVDPITTQSYYDAVRLLELNKEFLAEEVTAYITTTYPSYVYDIDSCKRDVREYIDSFKYDLVYTGNYSTLKSAKLYVNAVEGSETIDMFYLRNGTGLRNCTVQGLSGTLGSPNAYGTRRPSAGAFVSLDPGWGPADTRAWITNKSPYVQNVTTFGTGCVGLKIDGDLHNGGNDSIVANDFTQILSDGIGAWVTNLGRAELVSVFSYYGHIGYLAEDGGKIRATNGNSSYGTYGCVSEGVDATESPITGFVDNRVNDAQVADVFVDNNQIIGVEYSNAGNNYTTATYEFGGAGFGATVESIETRDNAVFEVRLTDPGDSSGTGGAGYVTVSNTAQGGNTTSIYLAGSDTAISSAYTGMRILITQGKGVGQYGYINSFNSGTKLASIYKESTGTAGWDHLIPGTTIESSLDFTTTYQIEPRLTFTSPGFTATGTTQNSDAWTKSVYGNTNSSHTGVAATGGTGTSATFNVVRTGLAYAVTLNAAGTLYAVGDSLTIVGADVGGATPANNITVTVTDVNSSTGAIEQFEFEGVGRGGRFVAVATGGTSAQYSNDGTTWTSSTLPATANWSSVAHGNGRFVAIASSSTSTAYSDDGITWTAGGTMPSSTGWTDVTYGNGVFLAISSTGTAAAYSTNGTSWTSSTLPSPGLGSWSKIAYGNGKFVAVCSNTDTAAYSTTGASWTATTLPQSVPWYGLAYGNNRFVAIAQGAVTGAYSLDGVTWSSTTMPATLTWSQLTYGQGLFFAVANGSTATALTSEDGINWTSRSLSTISNWISVAFGNPSRTPTWVALTTGSATANSIVTGPTTRARAKITSGQISQIKIIEPGSGYTSAPTMTIVDPNNTSEASSSVRVGDGVLAQPNFSNRGTGYTAAIASITGDGYADIYQTLAYINMKRLSDIPLPGSNIQIDGINDVYYKLVSVTELEGSGPYTARLQLSPIINAAESPAHNSPISIRIRYSQVRLTGHDFLDIGTGNFTDTNYPNTPLNDPDPAKETIENGGGRVFFTSTDQDGNFRVGGLFSVEQSTGIATLNADAFNLAGLQELQLGSVALGGQGATITEFSTDGTFAANSDNVIPTQRAIKTYIASQIGGGGSSLNVNTLTAGVITIAGQTISTTTGVPINVTTKVNFTGGVDGSPVALNYFLLS